VYFEFLVYFADIMVVKKNTTKIMTKFTVLFQILLNLHKE